MRKRAVDDGIGADVEQPHVDVAEQPPQFQRALRMAQRDVQDLVGDQSRLFGRPGARKRGRNKSSRRRSSTVGESGRREVLVPDPQRQAAGGGGEFHHPLDGARAPMLQRGDRVMHPRHRGGAARRSAVSGAVEDRGLESRARARAASAAPSPGSAPRAGAARAPPRISGNCSRISSARASVLLVGARGQQPVDHAVEAVEGFGQQRHGLRAGAAASSRTTSAPAWISRSTPKNSAALAAPIRPCTNTRFAASDRPDFSTLEMSSQPRGLAPIRWSLASCAWVSSSLSGPHFQIGHAPPARNSSRSRDRGRLDHRLHVEVEHPVGQRRAHVVADRAMEAGVAGGDHLPAVGQAVLPTRRSRISE